MRKSIRGLVHFCHCGWTLLGYLGIIALCLTSCHDKTPEKAKARPPQETNEIDPGKDGASGKEVYAAWYEVPAASLARRRAGTQELTAAHNRLPLGTRVRVSHLENGKSVLVRVTDRGITDRRVEIDLCKEAAQELDMIGQGIAKVRMEVLPDQ